MILDGSKGSGIHKVEMLSRALVAAGDIGTSRACQLAARFRVMSEWFNWRVRSVCSSKVHLVATPGQQRRGIRIPLNNIKVAKDPDFTVVNRDHVFEEVLAYFITPHRGPTEAANKHMS